MPITAGLYNYFEANGYRNPGDAYNGPFQYGMSTKHHYFQWLNENPEDQRAFNSVCFITTLLVTGLRLTLLGNDNGTRLSL